jgi:hypothetical protein
MVETSRPSRGVISPANVSVSTLPCASAISAAVLVSPMSSTSVSRRLFQKRRTTSAPYMSPSLALRTAA